MPGQARSQDQGPLDRSECVPVIAGGQCPNCGWSNEHPYVRGNEGLPEPHPVMPHGIPGVQVTGKCANCGAFHNLNAVKCDKCGFEPISAEMYDGLKAAKDKLRRVQGLNPLPTRPMPIQSTTAVEQPKPSMPEPEPSKPEPEPEPEPAKPEETF